MGDITRTKANVQALAGAECIAGESGDTIEAGEVVYLNGTSGWTLADASTTGPISGIIGIMVAPQDAVDGDEGISVCVKGRVTGYSGMTPGALHFISDTAGEVATAAGTKTRHIGYAVDATTVYVDPSAPADPT